MDWGFIFTASVSYALGAVSIAYCLAAIGLNMQFGYTGLLNFGQAAFLAAAGYGMAVCVTTFELSFWVGLLVGLLAVIVLALLLGLPTLRLRADYLAIVTIAAAEVVRLIVRSVKFKDTLGGSDGLQQFANRFYELSPLPADFRINFGPFLFPNNEVWIMIVGWSLVAIFSVLTWLLVRSPWGRILKGIREDEDAVRSLGKNVYWYKMQALMLGAAMAGFGGFVLGIFFNAVSPDIYATALTFAIYTLLILGGAARVMGPILGVILFAFLFQFVLTALNEAVRVGYIGFLSSTDTAPVRLMLVGIGLMLLMIFRPQGILGDRREIALDAR
jgi:neutral amino acid transport system permease protein